MLHADHVVPPSTVFIMAGGGLPKNGKDSWSRGVDDRTVH